MDNIFAITLNQKETEAFERAYKRSTCKTKIEFFELLVTRFFELDEDAPFNLYFEKNTTPTINRFIAFIENKFGIITPNYPNPTILPFPGLLTSIGKTYFTRFDNKTVLKLVELSNNCPNYNLMVSNLLEAIVVTKVDTFDSDEKSRQEKTIMEKISKVKPDFDGDTLDIPKLDKKELSWNYMMNSGYYFNNEILSELIKTVTNRSDYVITSVEKVKKPKEYNRTIVLNTTSKKKQKQFADTFDYYKKTMMQLIERIVIETLIIKEHCDPFIKCSLKISGLDIKTAINEIAKETDVEVITTKIPTGYKFVINAKTGEVFYPETIKIETT